MVTSGRFSTTFWKIPKYNGDPLSCDWSAWDVFGCRAPFFHWVLMSDYHHHHLMIITTVIIILVAIDIIIVIFIIIITIINILILILIVLAYQFLDLINYHGHFMTFLDCLLKTLKCFLR